MKDTRCPSSRNNHAHVHAPLDNMCVHCGAKLPARQPACSVNIVTVVDEGHPLELEKVQALIGGYVELHTLDDGSQLLIDEDGRGKRLPLNIPASTLAGFSVLGPAVLLRGKSRWSS